MPKPNLGRRYVGLTDDPEQRRQQHGYPGDWWQTGPFKDETTARNWEKARIAEGFVGGPGGKGWRWGYVYTITAETVEEQK